MAPDRPSDPEISEGERTRLVPDRQPEPEPRTAAAAQGRHQAPLAKRSSYSNLTPWVETLLFVHTYFAYTFVFYMLLLVFYKGYALEYPTGRQQREMLLVMIIPVMHHAQFYFANEGMGKGSQRDLCVFIFFCTCMLWILMYFLFWQAYVVPLESKLCFVSAVLVAAEGMCGVVNVLQTVTSRSPFTTQTSAVYLQVLLNVTTVAALIAFECMPEPEEEVIHRQNPRHLVPKM
ncbi:unnamed protein product [Prorocentrum cordatum]|uniref:Very-long-chain 3-oxoacyl-CoA synthase n=1 Tax=Prorocentrum cordatum TaxID=2364126 RepID=A0ABN9WUM9_9DINO|nr:unnamed protein product [Polarella glacialis]|mmetsp:Transcript_93252/g.242869  ORF Transcript_93252/g.242869 Transcript_93252/m.242869 type:complete len:233 (+) Transcript_93252:72-770(+)